MKNTMYLTIALLLVAGVIGVTWYVSEQNRSLPAESEQETGEQTVGGTRDVNGCLLPAGYAYDEDVQACVRSWELSEQEKVAAKTAVAEVGTGYALTVVQIRTFSGDRNYLVYLERGEERTQEKVYIKHGEVAEPEIVKLYFYDSSRDEISPGNPACARKGLVAVERGIVSDDPIADTINLLLSGNITAEEFTSYDLLNEFPLEGFELADYSLTSDGTLTLTFNDPTGATSGGSCRVSILWYQIEATALQFDEVKKVEYSPEELFQP